jgi:pimeloyl-ACP methyl ester carboxylesterase
MRKWFWILLGAAAVPVAGVIYQKFGEWSDRRLHGNPGKLVRIGNSTIYAFDDHPRRQDSKVSATVLFESGIGATSQNWIQLQRAVANHWRAVSYDRAGLGWSSGHTRTPTPTSLAAELRSLLAAAEITGPYLLVAHSFGGLVARQFAAEHAPDVVGLLLIDPMRPEEWPPFRESAMASVQRGIRLARAGRIAARFGLSRIFMRSTLLGSGRLAHALCRLGGEPAQNLMDRMLCEVGKMPREVWPAVVANWSRPEFYRTLEAYLHAIPQTAVAMHAAAPLDLPVTVLTPVTTAPLTGSQLQAISSNVREIIAPASTHWVHLDEPELVLETIREMLAAITQQNQTVR